MDTQSLERIERISQEPIREDEAVDAYINRLADQRGIDPGLASRTVTSLHQEDEDNNALETFCEALDASGDSEPTLADRVEASDDLGAALQQSTQIVLDYRRVFFILAFVTILIAAMLLVYPYLLS